ncbi:MAG: YidC/Oxa1 family membrane protein insertase [Pseudonocardiaceae bacterium]
MLDVLSHPVSGLMWFWHQVLGFALNPGSGTTWALSVVLLVITVRAALVIPAIAQARSARRMSELHPQIAALRAKYSHDRLELNRRIQRLQQDHGVSVLGGCLPPPGYFRCSRWSAGCSCPSRSPSRCTGSATTPGHWPRTC